MFARVDDIKLLPRIVTFQITVLSCSLTMYQSSSPILTSG